MGLHAESGGLIVIFSMSVVPFLQSILRSYDIETETMSRNGDRISKATQARLLHVLMAALLSRCWSGGSL